MLEEQTVSAFLDALASERSTPGGGSAAAVAGAMGAALLGMVGNLTLGKKKYAGVQPRVKAALRRTEALRHDLQTVVAADVAAFDRVMAAYALPRGPGSERDKRAQELESALHEATLVPMRCAELCVEVLEIAGEVAGIGNRNVLSDVGAGVACAHGALKTAALNVYINTASMKDEAFAAAQLERLGDLLGRGNARYDAVYREVVEVLRGAG